MEREQLKKQSDVVTLRMKEVSEGISMSQGTRQTQQDAAFVHREGQSAIGIVCDGMGGMSHGEVASGLAVECLAKDFFAANIIADIPLFLKEEIQKIDESVYHLEEADALLGAGTTIVSVIFQKDEAYWIAVGDSQIYVIRNGEMIAVNKLHNYRLTLDEMLLEGSITLEEYQRNEHQAESLISYLGIGGVTLMEGNPKPFALQHGDVFVLSSDGLYRNLSEEEICQTVVENQGDMQRAADLLIRRSESHVQRSQDNTSVVLLKYTGKGEEG